MTKRFLALVLVLSLIVSVLPVGVLAQGDTDAHQDHSCVHCNQEVTWTAWGDEAEEENTLPSASGHYVLTRDIPVAKTVALDDEDVVLCLSGHTLTASGTENTADDAFYSLSGTAKLTVSDCTAKTAGEGGTLTGATAAAINMSGNATLRMNGIIIRGNMATNGPAVNANGAVTIHLEKVYITENTGTQTGAVHGQGGAQVTIKDSTITGNACNDKFAGGMYITSASSNLTVTGKVIIDGNTSKGSTSQQMARDLQFYNAGNKLTVKDLTAGTKIRFSVRYNAYADGMINVASQQEPWDCSWLSYGEESISQVDGKLVLGHYHGDQAYKPWSSTTALPSDTGADIYYYLTRDVACAANAGTIRYTGQKVHLCLFGHTVTQSNKGNNLFTLGAGTQLTIEDCSAYYDDQGNYIAGGITAVEGSTKTTGSIINVTRGSTFTLAGGKIFGVKNTTTGASPVYIQKSTAKDGFAVFNMTGGEICGNETPQGGAIYFAASEAAPPSQFNMTGGKIWDNTAKSGGGAIYMVGKGQVKLGENAVISENHTASNGGAIYAGSGAIVELSGAEISDNEAATYGGGIYAAGANITMTGGKISENKAVSGAGVLTQSRTAFTMTGGTITGNTASDSGGGVYVSTNTGFTMTGGTVSKNSAAKNGGGFYLLRSGEVTLSGGVVEENTAANGAGVFLSGSAMTLKNMTLRGNVATGNGGAMGTEVSRTTYLPSISLTNVTVTGNTAGGSGAGIYAHAQTENLSISGNTVITGNTVSDKANNLFLSGKAVMTLAALGADAKVGISADTYFRPISNQLPEDYTARFTSDSVYRSVTMQDSCLYLGATSDHAHCLCTGGTAGCDHTDVLWAAWESTTSLPITGNFYLLNDIVLKDQFSLTGDLNLCLNGHTITAADGKRIYAVANGTTLRITDCGTTGAITGGTSAYGAALNVAAGGKLELYAGKLTGNGNTAGNDQGYGAYGAVYTSGGKLENGKDLPGGMVNMYGGEISGNTGKMGGALYLAGGVDGSTPSTFTMYGGIISGNETLSNGGAINGNTGSVINLQGGTISGNVSGNDGGAIIASGKCTVTLGAVTVKDNTAANQGGALGIYAGTQATIGKDALITGNTAVNGGAIYANGENTHLVLSGGTIRGNTATGSGGGVIIVTKSAFTMKSGTIAENKAASGAGGVYVSATTTFTMEGGTVTGNEAKSGGGVYLLRSVGTFTGGQIRENTATADGGGVYVGGATMELKGTTITKNTAANGGGIRSNVSTVTDSKTGEKTVYPVTIHMTSGTISNNTAAKVGGGIVIQGEGSVLTVEGGTVTGNAAENGGGIISQTKGTITLKDGTISGNTVKNGGGGIYVSTNTKLQMTGGTVKSNTGKYGGGIYFLRCEGTISGGKITGNTATSSGGGVYVDRATATFSGGTVSGNTSKGNGAGGHITGSTLKLSGMQIYGNSTQKGYGGGLFINARRITSNGVQTTYNSTVTMSGGSVSGNSAVHGGGIILNSKETVFTMYGGSITKNQVEQNGGGIYVSSDTTFNMAGGIIAENKSGSNGAGIYHLRSFGNYTGGTVRDNETATRAGAMLVNGEAASVTVKNVTFTDNIAQGGGGAIVCQNKATLNMESCTVTGSSAGGTGGAMAVDKNSFANLKDITFSGNTAGDSAGAFYSAVGTNVTMEKVTISDNKATGYGGGIYCRGNLFMTDCTVSGNATEGYGGGISTWKTNLEFWGIQPGLVMDNCLVENNSSGLQGGGIYLNVGQNATLRNVTITGNKAAQEGGALWAVDSLTMESVTATGNTSGGAGYAVYLAPSDYDGHSYFTGLMKMTGDMVVTDNENGDMYLGEKTTITVHGSGLGKNANVHLTLDSGVLANRIYGYYNYEGGNCDYRLSYGDRSITDPEEIPASEAQGGEKSPAAGTGALLYAGVGVFAVAIIAVVVLILMKRKKKTAQEANKE